MKRKMKQKNKSAFIRLLSCVMVVTVLLPLCAMVIPVRAFASDDNTAGEMPDTAPTVSLAWDTSTVTVTDGVATPYKNASVSASSYTMKYTVTVSGTVSAPVTVRIQSFDLSAAAGKEYASVDTVFTLTAEKPTATGSVTVYTHSGYATKVIDTGRIYTNEFGLRITEISRAKKQFGGDTIRSQVLAANGYTLDVVKNKDGANYGNGVATFQNGYVYDGMQRDYQYNIGSVNQVPANGGDNWYTLLTRSFEPMQIFKNNATNSATATLKTLMSLYGEDILVYFTGYSIINDNSNISTNGFGYKIDHDGKTVVSKEIKTKNEWYNDYSYWTQNSIVATGDSIITASYRDYKLNSHKYVKVTGDDAVYVMSFKNFASVDPSGNKAKDFSNHLIVLAANDTAVVAKSFYVEDRAYGVGDTVYLTVRFNKPVQFENDPNHPLRIQAKIGNSTANYFTYCGGNMTDTLIFSMTLSDDVEISGNNIELIGFNNEDYNKNIGDMFWNTSNKNNMWVYDDNDPLTVDVLEDALVKGQKIVCSVDTRMPSVSVRDITGNSGIVKSGSFNAVISKITNQGKIEIAWTKNETAPTTEDAWSEVVFTADEDGKATVALEKKGLTGTYYAHLRVSSISGNQAFKTVGPFEFDNQSPIVKDFRLASGEDASKYLKTHTIFFDIADVSIGVDEVYMRARHTDGSLGLKGDVSEILLYKYREDDNLLTISGGVAQINVTTDMLDLPDNTYGAYIFEFYAIDALGNQSDVYQFPDPLMFDNRDTFLSSLETKIEESIGVSIKDKNLYYNGQTLKFSHSEDAGNALVIDSLAYNGADVTANLSKNGMIGAANAEQKSFELTIGENVQGYIEIVFKLGDRYSNVLNFYVTGRDVNASNYQNLYAYDRLLINEVWQLSTAVYYSGNNRNGSYYATTNIKPIFSSRAKALEYAKFFEKQDIVIEYIDDEVERNNLEGGWVSNYRKADADKDRVAQVGQTWIRYKSDSWTLGSNNEEHWVYYFYSEEKETVIDPNLTPALNAAIDRNAKLICNYDGDNRIYLTANNTAKGYINSYSEPYYDPNGILKEAGSYQGVYSYEITITADTAIYSSFISYNGQEVPLVANYTFNIDSLKRGFVYYRQHGTDEWLPILNGESFKDKMKASGLYEICEFTDGYMTYFVYVDLDAPVISYELTVDGSSKNGYITSATSGGTLRASKFTVKELLNGVSGTLPTERDRWAYFYVLYSSIGGGEHAFMTMEEVNNMGFSLPTGIYKIYASDRLGNMTVQTIKINTEDIKVT